MLGRIFFFLLLCKAIYATDVVVSISPYRFLVEQIAGETLDVFVIVPSDKSSHTFEPTPKGLEKAQGAKVFFGIGELFEPKVYQVLKSTNKEMSFVSLKDTASLITCAKDKTCCPACGGQDLHVWLSPAEVKKQLKKMARVLAEKFPENKELYTQNLQKSLDRLEQYHQKLLGNKEKMTKKIWIVSHPAFAYLCRDYGCKQLSIEFEGKDPTHKHMIQLTEKAKKEKIDRVYIQPQYNNKGAYMLANQLGATVILIDPYQENIFSTYDEVLREIAHEPVH